MVRLNKKIEKLQVEKKTRRGKKIKGLVLGTN